MDAPCHSASWVTWVIWISLVPRLGPAPTAAVAAWRSAPTSWTWAAAPWAVQRERILLPAMACDTSRPLRPRGNRSLRRAMGLGAMPRLELDGRCCWIPFKWGKQWCSVTIWAWKLRMPTTRESVELLEKPNGEHPVRLWIISLNKQCCLAWRDPACWMRHDSTIRHLLGGICVNPRSFASSTI